MYYIIAIILVLCTACEKKVCGIDESLWFKLDPKEREAIIQKEYEQRAKDQAVHERIRAKELENERQRQYLEAQTAPLRILTEGISSFISKPKQATPCLQTIYHDIGRTILVIDGAKYLMDPLCHCNWPNNTPVSIGPSEDPFFDIRVTNSTDHQAINAQRICE